MTTPEPHKIYTISELNREAKYILQEHFSLVRVKGEISNLTVPSSGHLYFSLKDSSAQVQCVMFRAQKMHLPFIPKNGLHVVLSAQVGLYEDRGTYQLIGLVMEVAGDGLLQQAFEALKQRLNQEGLFLSTRKRPLPSLPRCIGVITSPNGAAIHDILSVLKRRFKSIPVIIYPCLVQGKQAAPQIVDALSIANQRQETDVLIVTRGGGSLEDLWPFNEEIVARAIFDSTIPVVSAVGHEIDFTIADFVADFRAATPSSAAELLSPNSPIWLEQIQSCLYHLQQSLKHRFSAWRYHLDTVSKRLTHPSQQLNNYAQQLDYLQQRLHRSSEQFLETSKQTLANSVNLLQTVNPLNTLQRGYAMVTRVSDQVLIQDASQVVVGDVVRVRLKVGELECMVRQPS